MKVGDKVPVTIGAHQVAMAEVKELGDGEVSLIVPATLVRMGVRSELTDLPSTEPTTQTIIDGVDRASATEGDQIVEVTSSTGETAPVVPETVVPEATPTTEANDAGTAEVVAPVESTND